MIVELVAQIYVCATMLIGYGVLTQNQDAASQIISQKKPPDAN
jgi:hypothetical protein